jgi:enoyl-[acyl-carrier protein] reductase II
VQMGTRMLSCAESPVHENWKQSVLQAAETDTVFLNQESRPALRALRTERTAALAPLGQFNVMENMVDLQKLYFGGDMEAAIPLCGQVCGRVDSIKSAKEIVEETMSGFRAIITELADQYAT